MASRAMRRNALSYPYVHSTTLFVFYSVVTVKWMQRARSVLIKPKNESKGATLGLVVYT